MLIRISLAQPARTVTRNEYFANTFHCFYRPQFSRMVGNARQHIAYILPDAALLVGAGVDKNSFKSKTAGLEAVEGVNEIIVLFWRDPLFYHNVTGHCLDITG